MRQQTASQPSHFHTAHRPKVSKSFTFFESPADLFRQTARMSQKNFYELIESGQWTRLYLDIEHYVDSLRGRR